MLNEISITLIVLLGLLVVSFSLAMFFFIKKHLKFRKKLLEYKNNNNQDNYLKKLEEISKISKEEAIKLYLQEVESDVLESKKADIESIKAKSKKEISDMSAAILVEAMEQMTEDIIDRTSISIKLEDSLKGKLIGKEGRNIKVFEKVTGVDLLIEKEPEVTVSSFNPIRRKIAFNLINRLIKSKSIEPSKIEKYFEEERDLLTKEIIEKGKDTIENILKIQKYIPVGMYEIVGRLMYRTSYSQNILSHSIECAKLAGLIAKQLGIDEVKARASAFIHDIGKSSDYEENNDHVETGKQIAIKYNLDEFLLNSILSHHDIIPASSIYSAITKVVDTLSSSRPGARQLSSEDFKKRMNTLESLALEIEGVKKVFAIKAGKEVRIIADEKMSDEKISQIASILKEKYETNDICSIRPIDIVVIKEIRFNLKTKSAVK